MLKKNLQSPHVRNFFRGAFLISKESGNLEDTASGLIGSN